MKANELRIGNWVLGNHPYRIKGSHLSLFEARERGVEIGTLKDGQLPEPIPLTEEWLIKFGFEELAPGIYRKYNIQVEPDGIHIVLDGNENDEWLCERSSVHHLQNVFYAITGEELKTKAPTE
jgi:hypothetical protein